MPKDISVALALPLNVVLLSSVIFFGSIYTIRSNKNSSKKDMRKGRKADHTLFSAKKD